ncbi:PP2C family protein-serine/threonine phosphatase [Desulfolutivibrio sulfoxidireducens]|uniref:PP2C family protein-serine/threonine phosphatase n=1 Tax=Desulfolutivibrio sulfoxidireducens TaxID=2773299 RepID=UPI00159D686E|nr:protein phosphatase 2C domain-containing protein [Desulfolutivibrio sulfoxidireducens]QLA14668.1 SpoIIE family protein phosphatase [Desulfolutivibrio sulfoxidireducens]
MRLEAAGVTDKGLIRDNNEDAFLVDTASGLFFVADGMGGLDAGEVASALALETVARRLFRGSEAPTEEHPPFDAPWWRGCADRLERAVSEANLAIVAESRSRFGPSGGSGMGTTLVGLSVCGEGFVVANVGDSRAYLYRDGAVSLLSEDHSLVMAQVRQGLLTPAQALLSPERHVIYRALGMAPEVEVDLSPVAARPGDLFLLCSDGLTDVVDDVGLAGILSAGGSGGLSGLCRELVAEALRLKSRDNVTVVLVRVLA